MVSDILKKKVVYLYFFPELLLTPYVHLFTFHSSVWIYFKAEPCLSKSSSQWQQNLSQRGYILEFCFILFARFFVIFSLSIHFQILFSRKLATAIIQRGTLKRADYLVAGTAWAKVCFHLLKISWMYYFFWLYDFVTVFGFSFFFEFI